MKELSLEHKNAIRDALSAYCDNYLSRNRAAESLNGVSAATVSTIVNSKYTNISDDMFIRIATQIGFSFDCWEIHESVAFKEISFMMTDAQMYKMLGAERLPLLSTIARSTGTFFISFAPKT